MVLNRVHQQIVSLYVALRDEGRKLISRLKLEFFMVSLFMMSHDNDNIISLYNMVKRVVQFEV